MKHKKTVIIIILMITTIAVLGSLYAIGNYTSQLSNIVDGVNYGRDSTDPEVRLMYATIDGMKTKYYSQTLLSPAKNILHVHHRVSMIIL